MVKERGVLYKVKEAKGACGGVVADATPHKQQPKADAELDGKNRSRASGFTLLEVMIALSIVGVALVALLGLAQRSISANDQAQQITRATLLAQSKMAEIEAGIESDRDGAGANFPAPDDAYRWRSSYSSTPVNGVRQVDLVVAWGDEGRNEAVRLISFVFREGAR